jgi:formylglycine-generating enzyme required for sulfatase activity
LSGLTSGFKLFKKTKGIERNLLAKISLENIFYSPEKIKITFKSRQNPADFGGKNISNLPKKMLSSNNMISQKIKTILFLLVVSIFGFSIYFALTKYQIEEKKQKSQKEITQTNITELPKFIYGVKKMVLISGGSFLMGNGNSNFPDERPTHFVTIDSFYMDETPVTYEDFKKYVDAGGAKPKYWEYETYDQPENPVTGINWYHAVDYCNWRNAIEGLLPAVGYRLPTEAEFEYAARGGLEGKKFPWGDEFDPSLANFDDERGVMKGNWWRLAKVKDTPPNNYELYGMSGNVWQWTNDWYDENYYQKSPKDNPIGPETGRAKVLRGGSWGSISPDYLRVAKRSYTRPDNYNYDTGFRCVRPAKEKILENPKIDEKAPYQFYQYPTISEDKSKFIDDAYGEEFVNRFSQYIAENYPNSIYFQNKIDEQDIITPKQMAQLIVDTTKEYNINPLFLTGIMVAESGFGTVSFPRWYNNPIAYHWQNVLMKNGLPIYEANPSRNRKYKDLKSGFLEFAKGIRRDIYINAAKKDLDAFHLLYVGYRANEWMYTIARVYNEVLGIKLDPHFPKENVGKYIYTDWEDLIRSKKIDTSTQSQKALKIVDKFVNWGYEIPSTPRSIDTVIIHSSYDALGDNPYSVDGVIYEYKIYGVAPHYLIDRNGTILRLVKEENIAYHGGGGKMPDGRTNINSFSIGIELINTKTVGPNEAQYSSLVKLVKSLKSKYKIKYILGHNEISPERKTDPWNFDWQKFNEMLKN